jgi:hypothetical protein
VLSKHHAFDADRLDRAIAATFAHRATGIPIDPLDALTAAFAEDATKQIQRRAFIEDLEHAPPDLVSMVADLAEFLLPHARAAAGTKATR